MYSACSVYDSTALTDTPEGSGVVNHADSGGFGSSKGATEDDGGIFAEGNAGSFPGLSGAGGTSGASMNSGGARDGSGNSSGQGGAGGEGGDTGPLGRGGSGVTAGASGNGGATPDASGKGSADGADADETGTTGADATDAAGSTDGASETGGRDGSSVPTICSTHPLSARTTWIATASHSSLGNSQESDPLFNPPSHAIDGNTNERWSTGKPQAGDEWLQIDFGKKVAIGEFTLQLGISTSDHPRGYAAVVSDAPLDFTAPALISGAGQPGADTVVALAPPAVGRYLLVLQTGAASNWWTVAEMTVTCGR